MKFFKFPVVFSYKKDAEQLQKVTPCYRCFDPNVKVVDHPEADGQSVMVDDSGVTEVALTALQLVEVLEIG